VHTPSHTNTGREAEFSAGEVYKSAPEIAGNVLLPADLCPTMSGKYKIMVSLSLGLAVFFSLPWITLNEPSRVTNNLTRLGLSDTRIVFLFVTVFLSGILFFQYNLFWRRRLSVRKSGLIAPLQNLLFNMGLVVVLSVALMWIADGLFTIPAKRPFFVFYLLRNVLIAFVAMLVTHAIELLENLRHEKIKTLTLQHQHVETELAALKAQIDPHFFFNSLNALNVLIRENTKEALAFVDHFSQSFRYILENKEQKLVTVREELVFLESYLFMMEKRFASGLVVNIRIATDLYTRRMPQFALQLLVENAVKHNQVSARHPLTVAIYSEPDHIVVKNNLQKKQSAKGYGIGLANLSKRYQLIHNAEITVLTGPTHFEVKLPIR
jgi:two-component system LytT family sensor kinase